MYLNYIFFEGTQAGVIKMAPVIKEFENRGVAFRFICSGQHRSRSLKRTIELFGLPEPESLTGSKKDVVNLAGLTTWAPKIMFKLVHDIPKDSVIITQGDSITTFVGTLWAKYSRCKLAHIEAGMRSFDIFSPFPEELIRVFADCMSDYLFASCDSAYKNIERYYSRKKVVNMGANTLIDSMKLALKIGHNSFAIPDEPYTIVTLHRLETMMNREKLNRALKIIEMVSKRMKVLFFMHDSIASRIKRDIPGVEYNDFLEYTEFVNVLWHSELVLTDSGGLQEECYYLDKPCLLLRDVTEHGEGIGKNVCLGFSLREAEIFLRRPYHRPNPVDISISPSKLIAEVLLDA